MNERLLSAVDQLHAVVDELTAPLAKATRCARGCSGCCVDGLTVFALEADLLRSRHAALFASAPHAPGACALLDETGACRAYADRPYVCRTQGLPLRWLEDEVERRDICPLNEHLGPPEALPAEACWTLGPFEARLRAWQVAATGSPDRVALRDLFVR